MLITRRDPSTSPTDLLTTKSCDSTAHCVPSGSEWLQPVSQAKCLVNCLYDIQYKKKKNYNQF